MSLLVVFNNAVILSSKMISFKFLVSIGNFIIELNESILLIPLYSFNYKMKAIPNGHTKSYGVRVTWIN